MFPRNRGLLLPGTRTRRNALGRGEELPRNSRLRPRQQPILLRFLAGSPYSNAGLSSLQQWRSVREGKKITFGDRSIACFLSRLRAAGWPCLRQRAEVGPIFKPLEVVSQTTPHGWARCSPTPTRKLSACEIAQLATSLPRIGNMASQDRFLSQFVARATRSGRLYPGAICHYALASIDGGKLLLTKPGLEFALLSNPVLDSPIDQAVCALSPEEREFLQWQVIRYVPSEYHDSALVTGAILEGNDTPGALAEAVFGHFPADWTTAAKQTHLSGIVARLTEIGVVSRTWSGRKVAYGIAKVDRCPLYDHIAKITG